MKKKVTKNIFWVKNFYGGFVLYNIPGALLTERALRKKRAVQKQWEVVKNIYQPTNVQRCDVDRPCVRERYYARLHLWGQWILLLRFFSARERSSGHKHCKSLWNSSKLGRRRRVSCGYIIYMEVSKKALTSNSVCNTPTRREAQVYRKRRWKTKRKR